MMDKPTTAISEFMNNQVLPELGLPDDLMPEAEVALRLAEFILSIPGSGTMASVAIDGASIKVGDAVIFDTPTHQPHNWLTRTPGAASRQPRDIRSSHCRSPEPSRCCGVETVAHVLAALKTGLLTLLDRKPRTAEQTLIGLTRGDIPHAAQVVLKPQERAMLHHSMIIR